MRGEAVLLHHGGVLTNKGSPPPLECIFSWDVRGNYSTKSKVAECVKRHHLGCVFELLGTLRFSKIVGEWGWVGSTMINSCLFISIKTIYNLFLNRLRRNRIQKRSAIYQNRRSKRIENTHFAFICTICIRVQICPRVPICPRVQINLLHLESRSKFAPGANLHSGANS